KVENAAPIVSFEPVDASGTPIPNERLGKCLHEFVSAEKFGFVVGRHSGEINIYVPGLHVRDRDSGRIVPVKHMSVSYDVEIENNPIDLRLVTYHDATEPTNIAQSAIGQL